MFFFRQTLSLSLLENTKLKCKKVFSNEFKCLTAASFDVSVITVSKKKIHTNQQSLKVKFLRLFTHVESVSFKSSKYEKQRKKFLMALQETNKNASLKCLEKGTVWLLSPND